MSIKIIASNLLFELDGLPLKEKEGGEKNLTVGKAISSCLAYVKSSDPLKAFLLAQEFYQNLDVEVTSDDAVFIKTTIKQSNYAPLIQGQLIKLLE